MKTEFWLVVNSNGTVKTIKNEPTTSPGEVKIKFKMDVPQVYFRQPQIVASIQLPDDQNRNVIIDAKTVNLVQETLKEQGIVLTIIQPKSEESETV